MAQMNRKTDLGSYYRVLDRKVIDGTIFRLVNVSLPEMTSRRTRKRILEGIMEEEDAYGMIEWWTKGSIVKKNMTDFHAILLCLKKERR